MGSAKHSKPLNLGMVALSVIAIALALLLLDGVARAAVAGVAAVVAVVFATLLVRSAEQ